MNLIQSYIEKTLNNAPDAEDVFAKYVRERAQQIFQKSQDTTAKPSRPSGELEPFA